MTLFHVLEDGIPQGERMEDALSPSDFSARIRAETLDTLVAEAAKHDPTAFAVLYERYYDRVYRYCYHRLGHTADAEDITGLIFMKALEALPSYQSRSHGFAPWLFRIARNAVIDQYRRRRSQGTLDELEQQAGDSDPVQDVLGSEQREELSYLLHHLSDDQREVVLMRYAADLTFGEIAGIMNRNEPAVRMLLHRGLRKLKAVMDYD
jgi:RNA polymerase sigma-70 factor (ECF subfamily)